MKIILKIIKVLCLFLLLVSILGMIFINIILNTVLNKEYIIAKLEESNYYENIYNSAVNNFENYIYQSGFTIDILNDVITIQNIEEDVNTVINKIFSTDDLSDIDDSSTIDDLESKLEENIYNELGLNINTVDSTLKQNIDLFIDEIVNQYENALQNDYIYMLDSYIEKAIDISNMLNNILMISIIGLIIIIILLYIKKMYIGIRNIGIITFSSGSIILIINSFITSRINIENFVLLNDATTNLIKNMMTEILTNVFNSGIILITLGFILVLFGNTIKYVFGIKVDKKIK